MSGLIEQAKQDYRENERKMKKVEEEKNYVQQEIEQLGETVQQKQILQAKAGFEHGKFISLSKLEFSFAMIPDESETLCKREIDTLTKEKRETQEWVEDNDVTHQFDHYFVTEIQERRSKILEDEQRCLRYESLIESYNEQLQKVKEDIEALGVDDDALKKRVDKQKEAITKIGEDIQVAQNSHDHYEKQRRKYSMDLKRLEDERKKIKAELKKVTDKAVNAYPNRPDVIPANEEKERARIDAQQRENAQNASYIARAEEIEENYTNITEV